LPPCDRMERRRDVSAGHRSHHNANLYRKTGRDKEAEAPRPAIFYGRGRWGPVGRAGANMPCAFPIRSVRGHWFSLMGICFSFPINRLCHLHVENFARRQPPFDHSQSDSGDFSGRKMDAKKIVDHPIDM